MIDWSFNGGCHEIKPTDSLFFSPDLFSTQISVRGEQLSSLEIQKLQMMSFDRTCNKGDSYFVKTFVKTKQPTLLHNMRSSIVYHLMQNLIQKQKTMIKSQHKVGAEYDDWIPIQNRIQNLDPRIRSHIQSVNWKLSKEQVWSRKNIKKNELILAMLTVQWWMRSVRPGLACCKKLCGRADGADFMDHRSSPRTAKYQLDNKTIGANFKSKSKRRILQCKGEKRTKKAAGHKAMRREGGCCENSGRPVNARHIVAAL